MRKTSTRSETTEGIGPVVNLWRKKNGDVSAHYVLGDSEILLCACGGHDHSSQRERLPGPLWAERGASQQHGSGGKE